MELFLRSKYWMNVMDFGSCLFVAPKLVSFWWFFTYYVCSNMKLKWWYWKPCNVFRKAAETTAHSHKTSVIKNWKLVLYVMSQWLTCFNIIVCLYNCLYFANLMNQTILGFQSAFYIRRGICQHKYEASKGFITFTNISRMQSDYLLAMCVAL